MLLSWDSLQAVRTGLRASWLPRAACEKELLSVTFGLSMPSTGPGTEMAGKSVCSINENNTSVMKIT